MPFVYQLALPKYQELIQDLEVDDNYNPSIPKWVDEKYLRNYVYDDA
jgi:hypothetical protein